MGCDIYAWVEYKNSRSWWECLAKLELPRSYPLFNALGYVGRARETDPPPIYSLKGWPLNLSITAQSELDDHESDAHNPSWLNLHEISLILDEFDSPELKSVAAMMRALRKNKQDVRLVFWFSG